MVRRKLKKKSKSTGKQQKNNKSRSENTMGADQDGADSARPLYIPLPSLGATLSPKKSALPATLQSSSVRPSLPSSADSNAANESECVGEDLVNKAIIVDPVDLVHLRELAWQTGGYQSTGMRIKIWSMLLGLDRHSLGDYTYDLAPDHPMDEQIERDVTRSITHYPRVLQWSEQRRDAKRETMGAIIGSIVRRHEGDLHYYQGFHDIVGIVLLVTGDDQLTYAIIERVSEYFFRDCMRESFSVVCQTLQLLPVIVEYFDREVSEAINAQKVEPFFCMPWVITWFSHDLVDIDVIARLFDVFLASHPLFPIYLSAALVLHGRAGLLALEDPDFAAIHQYLACLPKRGHLPWEDLLAKARHMMEKLPPRAVVHKAPKSLRHKIGKSSPVVLNFPPSWYKSTCLPDWLLLERRREKDGRRGRSKHVRQRRKAAGRVEREARAQATQEGRAHGGGLLQLPPIAQALQPVTVYVAAAACIIGGALIKSRLDHQG